MREKKFFKALPVSLCQSIGRVLAHNILATDQFYAEPMRTPFSGWIEKQKETIRRLYGRKAATKTRSF
jgi:hypothetical protein